VKRGDTMVTGTACTNLRPIIDEEREGIPSNTSLNESHGQFDPRRWVATYLSVHGIGHHFMNFIDKFGVVLDAANAALNQPKQPFVHPRFPSVMDRNIQAWMDYSHFLNNL